MHQRRFVQRSGRAAALLVLLGALVACGGGGGAPTSEQPQGEPALAASKSGELLAYVKDKLRARASQRQATPGAGLPPSAAPGLVAAAGPAGDSVLRSGSNVQEQGIDEPDLIKSDGQFIYTLDTTARNASAQPEVKLQAHRRLADGRIEATATLALPAETKALPVTHGMLLAESAAKLAVVSETVSFQGGIDPCGGLINCNGGPTLVPVPWIESSSVHLQVVNASASGGLAAGDRLTISGRLLGTRLIGNALFVVTTYAPRLAVDVLPSTAPPSEREAALALLSNNDVLPTLRINGSAPQPLLPDTDCYVQAKNASLGLEITTITTVDLASAGLTRQSRCIVGGSEAFYMSAQSLYLATTRYAYPGTELALRYPPQITTDLHKFSLAAAGPSYRGSGSVSGHLGWDHKAKSYRMSEHKGDLRVLSFTGELGWAVVADAASQPASPATLTVLRERAADQSLQPVSQLPNAQRPAPLGRPGEQVYAVRFLGDRGYLVTFRQVDPLYVLDLADPADPKTVGELKVTGFSDYLLPLRDGLLFGVGRQASDSGVVGGVKVSLFDVANPASPKELASQTFGERGSYTGLDLSAQGINMLSLPTVARIALPLVVWNTPPAQPQQGLQRFEVDTAARTMTLKSMLQAPPVSAAPYDLWGDRSLQIGNQIYYLSQGRLGVWNW
jgi:hypothetical protein